MQRAAGGAAAADGAAGEEGGACAAAASAGAGAAVQVRGWEPCLRRDESDSENVAAEGSDDEAGWRSDDGQTWDEPKPEPVIPTAEQLAQQTWAAGAAEQLAQQAAGAAAAAATTGEIQGIAEGQPIGADPNALPPPAQAVPHQAQAVQVQMAVPMTELCAASLLRQQQPAAAAAAAGQKQATHQQATQQAAATTAHSFAAGAFGEQPLQVHKDPSRCCEFLKIIVRYLLFIR